MYGAYSGPCEDLKLARGFAYNTLVMKAGFPVEPPSSMYSQSPAWLCPDKVGSW